ncbi:glycosyltransferase, partial [Campylobacter lari]|uniref:CDP-glycerol glycerophosphotransferase family protein n=1 Tax=Campylobacter lari TaxID=201 RepID=UPI00105A9FB0
FKKFKTPYHYIVVSAVYNVEKYIDSFIRSAINQRLDFKKNITLIFVDDGSLDNSARIIKEYQKKYPENIIYFYKENGGQSSARNLGLKYIKEKSYSKPVWVTFADSDDFFDRGYFYEVDRFLTNHIQENIHMVGCNVVLYYENQKIYKDDHPLSFKFKKGSRIIDNFDLNENIHLHVASSFFRLENCSILFDEKLKPSFEDGKFLSQYLLQNINCKSAFLPQAIYFYRKREDGSSTIDNSFNKDYLLISTNIGTLELLKENKFCESFVEFNCLYHLIWQIKYFINHPERASILSDDEKKEYLNLLDENFAHIHHNTILKFNFAGCWFFHKIGMLNCFKGEQPSIQIAYIEDYDPYKKQILLTYYTGNNEDIESIRIDGKEVQAEYKKITKHDFLGRVFCYQKSFWISIPKESKDKLELFVNGRQSMIGWQKYYISITEVNMKFHSLLQDSGIWLLMDRDYEADDNAEHFYRYIMQNHPERKIVFALKRDSKDWNRLKAEKFNLVEFGSSEFERIIKKSSKIISSHCDHYLTRYVQYGSQFIFLQHGVTLNDLSGWLNSKKIGLFITSTQAEYDSIASDYNRYKFSKKEVVLTGFARHDSLLKNNKTNTRQILIMPTWRKKLAHLDEESIQKLFLQSEYFLKYNSLLNNSKLKQIHNEYLYDVVFNPHPFIIPYLEKFNIPDYIKVADKNESLQKLFCNSSLMITDYSSVAFEMAYLKKPIIYYQFDKEDFFSSHTLQKGYFDYERDGFGPVVFNEVKLFENLEEILRNNCSIADKYLNNINSTFKFRDGKCCERIY